MCGIVGQVDLSGAIRANRASLETMRDRLEHRGPDDVGCEIFDAGRVGLAHRRLAIIRPTPEGRQPMADAEGRCWVVFNGEIYNYRALREELLAAGHTLRTETDTEVILGAYRAWDLDCVTHLRGMFAFALWDAHRGRLILARDRLGIKPLYYTRVGDAVLFASEPKALLAHPRVSARPALPALLDYLSYGYCPWDRSPFADVAKLPPATLLVHDARGTQLRTYWDVEPRMSLTGEAAAEAVRAAVDDAVKAHLVSDVPLAAFLSGGVDSSAVVACGAAAQRDPLRTISVDFDVDAGESELPYARQVASRYRTQHIEHTVNADHSLALLDTLAWAFDDPLADTSTLPTYLLCKAARADVTVALSGDGGDELFAGYRWYGAARPRGLPGGALLAALVDLVRGMPCLARTQALLRVAAPTALERHFAVLCLFDGWELARLAGPALAGCLRDHDPAWLFKRHFRRDLPLLTALQLLDLRTFLLDDILAKVDRAGMASGLEVRPPLLDHRVVELAFDIAPQTMLADGRGKWPLRRAMRDLLPAAVLARGKRGFSAPVSTWFRGGRANDLRRSLHRGRLAADGIIRPGFVDWLIDNYSERRWAKLWSLLLLDRWYARWIA